MSACSPTSRQTHRAVLISTSTLSRALQDAAPPCSVRSHCLQSGGVRQPMLAHQCEHLGCPQAWSLCPGTVSSKRRSNGENPPAASGRCSSPPPASAASCGYATCSCCEQSSCQGLLQGLLSTAELGLGSTQVAIAHGCCAIARQRAHVRRQPNPVHAYAALFSPDPHMVLIGGARSGAWQRAWTGFLMVRRALSGRCGGRTRGSACTRRRRRRAQARAARRRCCRSRRAGGR